MTKSPTSPTQKSNISTKQIAKDAVRGGPKSVKKDKRPTGHGQKG
jgi:hypothetical protein